MKENKELREKLEKLCSFHPSNGETLKEFIQQESIRFSIHDLATWRKHFSNQHGQSHGLFPTPRWLATVFCTIVKDTSPHSMCDPWAGAGFLAEVLRQECHLEEVQAFTKNYFEHELGSVLVPQISWSKGDPLVLLSTLAKSVDIFASILPMGMRSHQTINVTLPTGQTKELSDDLGSLIMVSASMSMDTSGIGLFIVPPSFFSKRHSLFHRFNELGLGIEAALALPSGTFAPCTNLSTYLVVIRNKPLKNMFAAQLSTNTKTNLQVINNWKHKTYGKSIDLGYLIETKDFHSIEYLRASEMLRIANKRYDGRVMTLGDLGNEIILGRQSEGFTFRERNNTVYIPLVGNSDVLESSDALLLKPQNYAQITIDSSHSNSLFVAKFLNSELGKELRELGKTGYISKLSKKALMRLCVLIPNKKTQQRILEIESLITTENNTVMSLQNELAELRKELWANPTSAQHIEERIDSIAQSFASGVKQHTSETLGIWFETLPFPLASILRAWQATPTSDFKTKYEHLLHFFEGAAEFVSIILLSAFSSNEAIFAPHRKKLAETMKKQNLSFNQATFGTWKLVLEYLGKQTRILLRENGKKPGDAKNDKTLCASMFANDSLELPKILSCKALAPIFSATNKMRNDWAGHGGVVGHEEAKRRNQMLLAEVEKLRECMSGIWLEMNMLSALHCRPKRGIFENEIAILMGSNTEFLKETREMSTWLDVEHLYLAKREAGKALKLLPLIQVGPSPQSSKNACYFFSRLDGDGARFVSYHYVDKPELTKQFIDATDAIKLLCEDC